VGAENKAGHITKGNVLEDLGFMPEEIRETELKLAIWHPLLAEIEARGLTQVEVASLLRIHQPDASLLLRGRLSKFSVMKLMKLAGRLGLTLQLTVKPVDAARRARTSQSRNSTVRQRANSMASRSKSRSKIAA
jgi:predicted XRE-type DNA-binding protein